MHMRRFLILALGITLLAGLASGQAGPRGRMGRLVEEYQRLQDQMMAQFQAGDYEKAAATCDQILKLRPRRQRRLLQPRLCPRADEATGRGDRRSGQGRGKRLR